MATDLFSMAAADYAIAGRHNRACRGYPYGTVGYVDIWVLPMLIC